MPARAGGLIVTPLSKVSPPRSRHEEVVRTTLIGRLAATSDQDLAVVLAPAGFGKTTTVAQWAARAGRPVVWVTANRYDNDPVVLVSALYVAFEAAGVPLKPPEATVTGDEPAFSTRVLPRLQHAVELVSEPITLVVDDVHTVVGARATTVLAALLDSLPRGSRLVLVGRSRPELPLALWRSQGRLIELTQDDLTFDTSEVEQLLRGQANRPISNETVAAVHGVTQGWPVAVYMQGVGVLLGREPAELPSSAMSAYLDEVVLRDGRSGQLDFLRRASVLRTMSARLCDELLDVTDSHERLHEAEDSTLLLNRLDGPDRFYRLHPLVRDHLLSTLSWEEQRDLHARAAVMYSRLGFPIGAIAHARESGDLSLSGRLIWDHAPGLLVVGQHSSVTEWLDELTPEQLGSDARLAMTAAWLAVLRADGSNALRWADTVASLLGDGWQTHLDRSTIEPCLLLLQALPGVAGYGPSAQMAMAAQSALPASHPLRPLALLIGGTYSLLDGSMEEGRRSLLQSRDLARALELTTTLVGSSGMLAMVATQDGDWSRAEEHIEVARRAWSAGALEDQSTTAWMSSVSAFLHARSGEDRAAWGDLKRVEAVVDGVVPLLPWLHVLIQAYMARAYAGLESHAEAVAAARRAHDALQQVPPSALLQALVAQADASLARTELLSQLSPAELRLWPYLMQRSTLREIAAEIHLSPETVKTELRSIYRKLGVSSRRELQELAETLDPEA